MTKTFSLMSLIGLFSVLCFTQCKKKNNSPTATVIAATLTGATNGWTVTGLTADKPINPQGPNPTNNWYDYLRFADIVPTFTFNTNGSYNISSDISYIPVSDAWSLNNENTALAVGGLTIKFTESTDTKIVGTIVYPKYGINLNEIANLTMTLTKRTQSLESEFPLLNTLWENTARDYISFYSRGASARYNDQDYELTYTYDSKTSKGTATDIAGRVFNFSISGSEITLTSDLIGTVVLTKQ